MPLFLFFIILLVLVLVHEFGHFIVAKKSGIRVDEFGFGFPPKLFGVKKGETEYTFNALPLGGFVKIYGENPDEESIAGPESSRSLVNRPKYIQAAVLAAGVFFNFLLAWFLLSAGFVSGLPTSVGVDLNNANVSSLSLTITGTLAGSPAEMSGLKTGDKIIFISSGVETLKEVNVQTMEDFIANHGGKEISISYKRGAQANTVSLIPKTGVVEGKAAIGISMDMIGILKLPIHKALWAGLKLTGSLIGDTAASLFNLLKDAVVGHANISSLTGPIGLVGAVGDAEHLGFVYLLSLAALISINLGIINLIPFPALDGGRLFFLLIEWIKGSRINPKVANILNAVGFSLLIILMLVVTYHDVVRLFVK